MAQLYEHPSEAHCPFVSIARRFHPPSGPPCGRTAVRLIPTRDQPKKRTTANFTSRKFLKFIMTRAMHGAGNGCLNNLTDISPGLIASNLIDMNVD
jgi:hypothetical protein